MHNINQFYKSITRFWRNVAFVSLFAIVSACDAFCGVAFDCGCIEADDFGEFQQFIITIKANGTDGSCDFDNTKGVSDDSQGAGLNRCLTQKPTTIDAWTSPKDTQDGTPSGCAGFDAQNGGIVIQQQCISSCIQECQINRLSASASAEPYWEQTSPTFTISPGHEIIITATGSVSLAEGSELGPFFVKPNNFFTHTKNPLGSDNMIADVQQGGEKSLRFQGAWSDEKDSANDNTDIGPGEIDYFSELDFTKKSIAYNGVRRLIAYVEPHPEGYKYSSGVSDEKLAVTGVPFRADVDLWKCNYDVSLTEKLQSNCFSDPYDATTGYDNATGDMGIYSITSTSPSPNLGEIGGMVRWDSDGLGSWNVNPFKDAADVDIVCSHTTDNCRAAGVNYVNNSDGKMIGRSLQAATQTSNYHGYTNSNPYPVTVSFKNLSTIGTCSKDNLMEVGHYGTSNELISIRRIDFNGNWSEGDDFYYMEAGDTLKMADVAAMKYPGISIAGAGTINVLNPSLYGIGTSTDVATFTSTGPTINSGDYGYFALRTIAGDSRALTLTAAGVAFFDKDLPGNTGITLAEIINGSAGVQKNCAEFIGYRIDKVHDIKIKKSGLISFAMLSENFMAVRSCNLSLRIVNPGGSRVGFAGLEQDFYEYGNGAREGVGHPTNLITVQPQSSPFISPWTGLNNSVYVRKGQILRFGPKSWVGERVVGMNSSRQCGIGMAMRIEPRLALLCRGVALDEVADVNCTVNEAGDGCTAFANECYDRNDAAHYCPFALGFDVVNPNLDCQVPVLSYNAAKCDLAAGTVAGDISAAVTSVTCNACYNKMLGNAALTPKISIVLDQCYDLENYSGKVGNIPKDNAAIDPAVVSKGAKNLGAFGGSYGNLEGFIREGSDPINGNVTYKISNIAMSYAGRLQFGILDGEDFNRSNETPSVLSGQDSYLNTTSNNFAGDNGYKISLAGNDQFFNGSMLEVVLCQDHEDDDNLMLDCTGSSSKPTQIATQPDVVTLENANDGSDTVLRSHYKFNDYGRLIRVDNPGAQGAVPTSSSLDDDEETSDIDESIGNFVDFGEEFYVHSEHDSTTSDGVVNEVSNIRLAFKIKDPDVFDCIIASPSLTQTCTSGGACDGIKLQNKFYTRNTPTPTPSGTTPITGHDNEICAAGVSVGTIIGTECQKEFHCANIYENNSGYYRVVVRAKNPNGSDISSVVDNVVQPVVKIMDGTERGDPNPQIGQAERVYKLIITDPTFKLIVQLVFMLAVTFYGIGYLMGVSQFSQGEVIGRVVKIGVIYLFIGANGWFWFDKIFVQFFKEGTDYLAFLMATSFDTSPELQNALAQNDFYDKSVLFSSIDNVFGIFFSDAAQKKIAALLFASIFGWAYLFIIYMAFLLYVYAVANAVLLYLTSQVFISILFVIGPIFFIFLFFKQTQDMFDKWLQQLIGFSLQQIFLLTTLAFFNMMMYEILKLALGYRVCWDDVLVINKPVRITLLSFWTLASLPPRGTLGPSGINSGVPSIFSILFIWVIASLMKQFITFMTDLAASIGGGVKASDMGSGVKEAASKAGKAVGEQAGDLWKKHGQSRIEKLDRHLFDSGRLADKDRADKELENKTNQGHKRSMVKSGEDAARQHSILHKDKLAGMSKEDQQKELNGVRDKAMNKKGKELGLNEKEVEALKKDKGLKYTGDTVIGAAAAAIKQAATKGGSIRTAIKDKDADIDSSRGDMKKALQSTDAAGREKIMKGIKSGRLGVKKKSLARAKSAAGSAAKQIAVKGVGRVGLALAKVATLGQNKAVREAYNKTKTTSEKEFAKAKGQLEKNGDISKRRAGLGRFRKEAETDQIRARMKENIAASKPALSNNRVEEVAFAQQQSNVAAELESGKGGSLTRKAGIISAVIGREKKMTQGLSLKRNEDGKVTSVQTAKGEKRDAIKEDLESDTTRTDALQEQKAAADTKMQAADDSSASAQKEVTENLGGDSMVDFAKSLEEKKGLGIAQFIPGSKTRAKKKELSSKMDEMVGTGEYESASGVVPGVVKAERMKDKLGAAQYVPFTKTRAQKHKLNDMITEGKSHNDYGKHIESSKNANEGARVASNYKAQSQGVKSQIDKAGGGSIPKQENTSNAIPERNLEVASAPSLDESQKPSAPSREPSSDNRPPPVYESDDEK